MDNKINKDDIIIKFNKIVSSIENLSNSINNINIKIVEINKIYMRFEFNKTLELKKTNSYLKLQVDLLNNEKKYYSVIKEIILNKILNDIYDISQNTILILLSLNNINIEKKEDIKNILDKIEKIKKFKIVDCNNILELLNKTLKNLNLINDFLNLMSLYINEVLNESKKNNIHTNNFKISLINKKNHLQIEYIKYCDQLKELIDYFLKCSDSINIILKKQNLFNFL